MKKIFILTGEPSGDRLASEVIKNIKKNRSDVEYLSVGGKHLNSIGIKSIFDQKEITYLAFTDIFFNIFKIKRKINETASKILEFNPDILFSVDSPDFALRVSRIIKNKKPANEKIVKHIDRCLSCYSCMTTCPSGVNYMHLIDHGRNHIEKTYKRPLNERIIRDFLSKV